MSATINRSHALYLTTRSDAVTVDARCSCNLWNARNVDRKDARESHGQHLDQYLGPDATGKERAS